MALILNWDTAMRIPDCLTDQCGIALVMALILLLTLSGLVLAALSLSAFEPQISQNLVDTVNARMLADSGIDYGYNTLINTADWSTVPTISSESRGPSAP
ncbi:MAG: hypothetical protein HY303_16670 [Candidatus Wallbacteria bacterium]|nr:hypothetical protein [Candidatus Wallbacteria bacterium]